MNKADADLIQQFLDELWLVHGMSVHTQSAYGSDLRKFAEFLVVRQSNLLRGFPDLLGRYFAERYEHGLS